MQLIGLPRTNQTTSFTPEETSKVKHLAHISTYWTRACLQKQSSSTTTAWPMPSDKPMTQTMHPCLRDKPWSHRSTSRLTMHFWVSTSGRCSSWETQTQAWLTSSQSRMVIDVSLVKKAMLHSSWPSSKITYIRPNHSVSIAVRIRWQPPTSSQTWRSQGSMVSRTT